MSTDVRFVSITQGVGFWNVAMKEYVEVDLEKTGNMCEMAKKDSTHLFRHVKGWKILDIE